ncbi:MAG: amidohydrolase family protein [bacterium]|nr:amidohydrolase family protein [bacterium]
MTTARRFLCASLLSVPALALGDDHPYETDEHRVPAFQTGGDAVIRNVTIHSAVGPAVQGDVAVKDGKIVGVGEVEAPEGAHEIDGEGMHLAPGVVDCHSHMAIERGVNEGTVSITAEVTIADSVNPDDLTIFRALAGGVTTIRQLHGSANAIGGRDSVLKLKWKRTADELRFPGALEGIKFALGENPKRSRSRENTRFPGTRMGVEAIFYRAFERAREYQAEWDAYEKAKAAGDDPAPPRRDVRLDVLAGILEGDVHVHSHCYRADEILMLIRASQHFGFQIATLQHVLEGYKVAHEMAEAKVPGSTFSDWWAYKVEAYDAVPHCAALMMEAGVLTSINSDSGEMVRRLYAEAGKSLRYGDMGRVNALQLVTLNPAKQLGIGDRVGSIEVGKDADLVLLNGDPLSPRTRVEWTMVDGHIEFTRRDAFGLQDDPPAVREIEATAVAAEVTEGDPVVALVGGTIHPATGPAIEQGTLLMQSGVIVAVGADVKVPFGATIIDCAEKHLWPGMISLNSAVGLQEIGAVRATIDTREMGGDQPDLRVTASINADSAKIGVTRHNGITRVQTAPQGGGPLMGQSAVLRLAGDTWEEMLTVDRDMLHVRFPSSGRRRFFGEDDGHGHDDHDSCDERVDYDDWLTAGIEPVQGPPGRGRRGRDSGSDDEEAKEPDGVKELRDMLADAREYARRRELATGGSKPAFDPRLDALAPFARGEKKMGLHVGNAQTILFAVKFAQEENLDVVLYGAREAWKVVDVLAQAAIPVVLGPIWTSPSSSYDPYDAPFAQAAVLARAGVPFAIMTADTDNERNLPLQAATASAYGLPEQEAVRAVTYYPARILGVAERHGSLEVGRAGDVLVTSGHLLDVDAPVERMFIDGVEVDPRADKHTRLYRRYRERLHSKQGVAREE